MGRKSGNKPNSKSQAASGETSIEVELSPQKKFDLLKNNDKLLRVTSMDFRQVVESHMLIDKLLQKSISIESEIDPGFPNRDDDAIQELTKWMLKFGAKIEGVEIKEIEEFGYGICASKDFIDGEFIISVPRKLMMTTEFARKSELDYLVRNDPMLARMPNMVLALFVLLEKFKGEASFWAPYLNCLPSSYLTVLYYTISELDALKGSPIYGYGPIHDSIGTPVWDYDSEGSFLPQARRTMEGGITRVTRLETPESRSTWKFQVEILIDSYELEPALKQCQNIARQYVYLRNLFHKSTDAGSMILKKYFTYEQYRWAVSTVMTRQNFIPASSPDNPMILALIPWWDMGNHDNAQLTTDYNMEADRSEYRTCRPFAAGEQVFMSYGKRPNSELFLHNGFVHVDNQSDGVKLRLGVSKSDPLVNLKCGLLKELCIPSSAEFLLPAAVRPFHPHGKFFAFLRIFNMDQAGLEEWTKSENKDDLMLPDLTLPVDTKVWRFLSTRIKLLLAAYPTSLKEDENILAEQNLTPCLKLAILQRMTEKRILNNTLTDLEVLENGFDPNEQ